MITFHFWNMTEYFLHKLYIQGVEKILDHKEGDLEKTYNRVLQEKLLWKKILHWHSNAQKTTKMNYHTYNLANVVSFWFWEQWLIVFNELWAPFFTMGTHQ